MSQAQSLPTLSAAAITGATVFIVSRHQGAVEWLHRRGFNGVLVAHLDTLKVPAGSVVLGSLPPGMVADLNGKGVGYYNLSLYVPEKLRGVELTPEQMDELGCKLQYVTAQLGEVIA